MTQKKEPIIIAMSGKIGSGKDTFVTYFRECAHQKGIRAVEKTFARHMKHSLASIFDIDMSYFYTREKKEITIPGFNVSPREMMLHFNTFITACRPELFCDIIKKEIEMEMVQHVNDNEPMFILVTDARLEREFGMLRAYRTVNMLVKRDTGVSSTADNHVTETYIDSITNWDYVIDNNGSLDDLKKKADEILNDLLQKD